MRGGTAGAPQATWRDLDQREPGAQQLGERGRIAVGMLGAEQCAQLLEGARRLLDQSPAALGQCREVQTGQALAEGAAQAQVQDGLQQRAQVQTVLGGDQVDGAALQPEPDRRTSFEQRAELLRGEVGQPGPEAVVRRVGGLGL